MKDKNGTELKIGQLVTCVEPLEGFLEDKEYKILGLLEDSGRIVINPDKRGIEGHYKSTRFVVKE